MRRQMTGSVPVRTMRNRCTSSGLTLRFADFLVPFGFFLPFSSAGFFVIDTTLATAPPSFSCSA
jgi:hypothetical protein